MSKFTQLWDGPVGEAFEQAVQDQMELCKLKFQDRGKRGYGSHHPLPMTFIHGHQDLLYILEEKVNRLIGMDEQISIENLNLDEMIEETGDVVVYGLFLLVILQHLSPKRELPSGVVEVNSSGYNYWKGRS